MAPSGFYSKEYKQGGIIASGSYEEKGMNEWKELKIDNLPPDFLIGGYEVQYKHTAMMWTEANAQPYEIISFMCRFHIEYRYRKPETLPPPLEDLANDYYESDAVGYFGLNNVHEAVRETMNEVDEAIEREVKKAFIAGRESADIPPEAV